MEKQSLDAATNILKTITKNVKQINDIKTAEIATLFTVAKQDADTALANELAVFCESANMDYFEVLKLLDINSKAFGRQPSSKKTKMKHTFCLKAQTALMPNSGFQRCLGKLTKTWLNTRLI